MTGEDLLDQQVDRPAAARIDLGAFAIPAFGEHVGDARQQPLTVALRVVHAVDVIQAQSLNLVLGDQAEQEAMGGLEHLAPFHAQTGQLVDVEEAAIVDL